jgi:flagellar assembly factor FliW
MIINTKGFGWIEIVDEKILRFPRGIYGFEEVHDYVLLGQQEPADLFLWLQAVAHPELCFIVIDPTMFMRDYILNVPEGIDEVLALKDDKDLRALCIVTVPRDRPDDMTCNLKCPLLINDSNHTAMQVILEDDRYDFRHRLLDLLHRGTEGE